MLDTILTGDDVLVDDHFVGLCLGCQEANSAGCDLIADSAEKAGAWIEHLIYALKNTGAL